MSVSGDTAATFEFSTRGTFLVAVGNIKILRGTPEAQVRSLLDTEKPDKDGKIALSFMRHLDYIFVYPVFPTVLGQTNVLRYLVEEGHFRRQ